MSDRSVSVLLAADVSGYVASISKASLATKDFAKSAEKSAAQHKESWNTIGKGALVTGGAILAGVGVGVKAFMDFDAAMSKAQAGTMATGASLKALREAAIDAGAKTQFSATEAADAITAMGKAGVSTADILGGGLKGTLALAAAGQLDVASASEIAATAMNQFGLEGRDIPHIADLLAAGAGKAMGSVEDLAGALKFVGPVAKGVGVSIEETTGTLALFAQQGLKGEIGGTALRSVLTTLTGPSGIVAKRMEDLNLKMYDVNGKFIGLKGAAGQLQAKLGPLDDQTRNLALTQIFGTEAAGAARFMYEGGAPAIAKWTKEVNDAGYATEQAAMLTDNLKGDVERLGGSLSSVLIQSGSATNGMLRGMTKELQGVVDLYGSLPVPVQQGATVLGSVAGAASLVTGGLLLMAPRIATTKAALKDMGQTGALLSKGLSGTASILKGPVGIGLAAAVIGLGFLAKSAQESTARVDELTTTLDTQTGAVTENTRAWVTKNLSDSGALASAKNMGISVVDVTNAVLGNSDALMRVNTGMDGYATATRKVGEANSSGRAGLTQSTVDVRNLRNAIGGGNDELTKAVEKTKLMAEANDAGGSAAAGATGPTKALSSAEQAGAQAADDNKKAHDALITSVTAFGSALLTARGDARAYEAAIDAATASLKANGKTLDIGTEKGRNNQSALDGIATSALKAAQSNLENAAATGTLSKATTTVTTNVGNARTQFIDMAHKMGMSKTAAALLADQSGLTAGRVKGITNELIALGKQKPKPTADVEITPAQRKIKTIQGEIDRIKQGKQPGINANSAAGMAKIAALQRQIDALRGKTITVKANFSDGTSTWGVTRDFVKKVAGGPISGAGTGTSDSIPAMLSHGEYVVTAAQTAKHRGLLDAINGGAQGFAAGGMVGSDINVSMPGVREMNALRSALTVKTMAMPSGGGGGGGGNASNQALGHFMMRSMGFSESNWPALRALWNGESGWSASAHNASSGAHGIPQSLPASKMRSAGADYMTSAATQIKWGLGYIKGRYGSPAAAYSAWQGRSPHWYGDGGMLMPGGVGMNEANGRPERILSAKQTDSFDRLVAVLTSGSARQGSPSWDLSADGDSPGGGGRGARGGMTNSNNTTTFQAYGLDAEKAVQKAMRDWEFAAVPR